MQTAIAVKILIQIMGHFL